MFVKSYKDNVIFASQCLEIHCILIVQIELL